MVTKSDMAGTTGPKIDDALGIGGDLALRPRRGRPSRQEVEAIDKRVLAVAGACFLEHGIVATTMDGIAERAGVTKATLYQRYADKGALLRAVMHDRIETWSNLSSQRGLIRGETIDQRLRHYARSMLHWSLDADVLAFGRLIQEAWGSAPAVAEEMHGIRLSRMLDLLESDIVTLCAREGGVPDDPRQLAEIFLGMLRAFSPPAGASSFQIEQAIARFTDRVVDILMLGRKAWTR
ncbi:TetR/AcrR family transcriptional regulator [Sphingobium sp. H39-3-25]|uniref:TetR/AcrR family transcriptional regulator n=1 Tax=Sphingobium arseniciresistens TaxID=3030834 RepID=UPI0023B9C624|nr:TetR/AcrR family transcriptional regulator [Sphingobium arseniciresistens]